jgi:hypothetical protein
MGNLEFGPDAHWILHLFAGFLLVAHISGGCVGILSGAAAVSFRKGTPWHSLAGKVFVISMLIMSGVAAGVAPFLDQRVNVVAALVTFYLVVTAWVAAKRRIRAVNAWDIAGLLFIVSVTAYTVYLQQLAANSASGTLDGSPPQAFYIFVLIGTLATIGDALLLWRGGITGMPRIARHLWRMMVSLFVAVGSLFMGQPQVFPEPLRQSDALRAIPVLLVILTLLYWLLRFAIKRQRALQ